MSYSKFKAKKVQYNDFSFASQLEAAVYQWLQLREKNKEISDLRCQETVYLTKARIISKPDFSFIENGSKRFAESKGFETPEWRIKRRLWEHYGPGPLEIYKGSAKSFRLHETIIPICC
jgi:hypothetical protein